jgi:hypothetical protein
MEPAIPAPDRADLPGRLSLARILRDTGRIWWRDLGPLTVLAAVLELPIVVADLAAEVTPTLRELRDGSAVLTAGALLVFLYGTLSHHFLAGLLERVVASDRHGHQRATLGEVLRDLPWLRLVVADLLLTGLIVLGLATLLLPGLVVLTWFAVVPPIINLERRPVGESFVRSYRLVRGHSWRVAVLALGAFAIPQVVVAVVADALHSGNVLLDALAHAVPAIVLLPLAALPIVLLAFDLVALDRAVTTAPGPVGRSHR